MLGMLWFMNQDMETLQEKVEDAALYFSRKYGQKPNQAHINPDMLNGEKVNINGLKIVKDIRIMQQHVFIGHQPKEL